ncbi:VOC family protein [Nocardia sp. CA2R105]|uniref:VOC family protein n=1 Tax=Nocardia coffeae TaxID=2873381 RepID=UPI001CA6C7F9|nr:VOC family protein [Nocardia coffeae]MBY8861662.1 VOC family protein [Nocardia coffeae]
MSIHFNHTIVACHDAAASARFWADMLGLEIGKQYGPFLPVTVDNGVTFDFALDSPAVGEIPTMHYAFLVSEEDFDAGFARIQERGLRYWADPHAQHEGEINHNDGGRGVYFRDPNGHALEFLTVPYGGWPEA